MNLVGATFITVSFHTQQVFFFRTTFFFQFVGKTELCDMLFSLTNKSLCPIISVFEQRDPLTEIFTWSTFVVER